ncbi:MAG: hypothetical protein P8X89_24740 [Reinekea sp.]
MLPKKFNEPMGESEIFEKIEIRISHSASTEESRIQVLIFG